MTEEVGITEEQTDEGAVRNDANNNAPTGEQRPTRCMLAKALMLRVFFFLEVPKVLVFDIILYLGDVVSDIWAGVSYFQQGHPVWGSLTFTFVLLPAISWAAVSWSWWYDDYKKHKHPSYRRNRMWLSLLLLDPLVR